MPKEILTGTHPAQGAPVRVGPSLGPEFNLVRAFLIPKACFKLEDAHFAFDSSFVVPDGFDIAPLKDLLDKHPGTKLSIFGHADPTGDDTYNKALSGRRAQAIFGLLTRDVAIWQKLHDSPKGGDNWKPEAEKTMRATTGLPASTARKALFKAYMDHLCTARDASGAETGKVELTKDDFLARGADKDGKGDLQGCSEFNPLMIFSKDEKAVLDKPANHPQRNQENRVNRRVMVLLFRPGSQVDPQKWPCPTVEEGTGKCLERFHSDGETRRSNQKERREFKDTKDTFACRFYDRITNSSPCQVPVPPPPAVTVDELIASLPSTENTASKVRPDPGTFKTKNTALDFAAPTADLMVVIQDAGPITVKADKVQPPANVGLVRWQFDQDPADTVAKGTPGLDTTTGEQVVVTPNTAGTFRLICFNDTNGNGKHDPGEELRVLRMVIVKLTPQPGATFTLTNTITGAANRVNTNAGAVPPMVLRADILLEGGGAGRKFGIDQVTLGNVGNCRTDDFVVNYPGRPAPRDTRNGTEEEDPDFKTNPAAGFPSPMLDSARVATGNEATGGLTPFRSNSNQPVVGAGPGGNGEIRRVTSLDAPAMAGFGAVHPRTNNPWTTTQGSNGFREFAVGFTAKFPKNYTALGTGEWTFLVNGTRGAGNVWVDDGTSSVTGTAWDISGFPKTGDAARVQILGRSFVSEVGFIIKP
jgi:hypothetical protein